jgi:hypothetical protein
MRKPLEIWDNDTSCCLHVVVEDDNTDDHSVKWCLHLAETGKMGIAPGQEQDGPRDEFSGPYPHAHCAELARAILAIPEDERLEEIERALRELR